MLKKLLFALLCIYSLSSTAQQSNYAVEASIVGGKEQLEQVLQTQLTLPKTLLTSHYQKDIIAYFDIDDEGKAINIRFDGQSNNMLRAELKRILGLMKYTKSSNAYKDPYFLTFDIATDKYNRYYKQRSRLNLKKEIAMDSSAIVYSKADRAPEFHKNGEAGMAEFVMASMEYPKLAIEKSVEGTVVIDFVVEANGYVTAVSLRQALGAGCSEEALKVIKLSKWQPATLNGKYVRYKMSYPITFSLRNISNDNSSSGRTLGQ
jgi:TonB family protein